MTCNIDARGKAMRLILGALLAIIGLVTLMLAITGSLREAWWAYAGWALLLSGAFGIFEGWAGWCVVRAMGFKTRL